MRRSGTLVVVLVLLVLIAAGAYFAWTWYTTTPQYATLKAFQAVSDRDWDAFRQWVDVDAVVNAAVDARIPPQMRGAPPAIRQGLVTSAKAALRQRVTQGVPGVPQNLPFAALLLGRIVRGVTYEGADALVMAVVPARTPVTLDLRLRRQSSRWRVVEIRNIGQLLGAGF